MLNASMVVLAHYADTLVSVMWIGQAFMLNWKLQDDSLSWRFAAWPMFVLHTWYVLSRALMFTVPVRQGVARYEEKRSTWIPGALFLACFVLTWTLWPMIAFVSYIDNGNSGSAGCYIYRWVMVYGVLCLVGSLMHCVVYGGLWPERRPRRLPVIAAGTERMIVIGLDLFIMDIGCSLMVSSHRLFEKMEENAEHSWVSVVAAPCVAVCACALYVATISCMLMYFHGGNFHDLDLYLSALGVFGGVWAVLTLALYADGLERTTTFFIAPYKTKFAYCMFQSMCLVSMLMFTNWPVYAHQRLQHGLSEVDLPPLSSPRDSDTIPPPYETQEDDDSECGQQT